MKKYNDRLSILLTTGRRSLFTAVLACGLAGCDKPSDSGRPLPPQAPPRPQAQLAPPAMQKAIFSYSSSPSIFKMDGNPGVVHFVIRT